MAKITDLLKELDFSQDNEQITIHFKDVDYVISVGEIRSADFAQHASTGEVNADGGLNLRDAPNGNIIWRIPNGTGVIIKSFDLVSAGKYRWVNVKVAGKSGWVAVNFIDLKDWVPPIPAKSKIGLHVYLEDGNDRGSGNGNDKLVSVAEELFNAKKPLSFTVLIDTKLSNRLQPFANTLVHRVYTNEHLLLSPIPAEAEKQGHDFVERNYGAFKDLVKADNVYVQMTNEQDEVMLGPTFAAFQLGIGKKLEEYGYKGCLFNDGYGHPEPTDVPSRLPVFEWMIAHKNALGVHMYSKFGQSPLDTAGDNYQLYLERYKWLYGDHPLPIIIGNEAGRAEATFLGRDITLADIVGYNAKVATYKGVVAFNWWQYNGSGSSDWHQSAINSIIDDLKKAILGL